MSKDVMEENKVLGRGCDVSDTSLLKRDSMLSDTDFLPSPHLPDCNGGCDMSDTSYTWRTHSDVDFLPRC